MANHCGTCGGCTADGVAVDPTDAINVMVAALSAAPPVSKRCSPAAAEDAQALLAAPAATLANALNHISTDEESMDEDESADVAAELLEIVHAKQLVPLLQRRLSWLAPVMGSEAGQVLLARLQKALYACVVLLETCLEGKEEGDQLAPALVPMLKLVVDKGFFDTMDMCMSEAKPATSLDQQQLLQRSSLIFATVNALGAICSCSDNHDLYTTDAAAAAVLLQMFRAGLIQDLAQQTIELADLAHSTTAGADAAISTTIASNASRAAKVLFNVLSSFGFRIPRLMNSSGGAQGAALMEAGVCLIADESVAELVRRFLAQQLTIMAQDDALDEAAEHNADADANMVTHSDGGDDTDDEMTDEPIGPKEPSLVPAWHESMPQFEGEGVGLVTQRLYTVRNLLQSALMSSEDEVDTVDVNMLKLLLQCSEAVDIAITQGTQNPDARMWYTLIYAASVAPLDTLTYFVQDAGKSVVAVCLRAVRRIWELGSAADDDDRAQVPAINALLGALIDPSQMRANAGHKPVVHPMGVEPTRALALLTAGNGDIFRVYEMLMRMPGAPFYCPELLQETLPRSLPAMQMCYSLPKVAAAAIYAVTTSSKWLLAATAALDAAGTAGAARAAGEAEDGEEAHASMAATLAAGARSGPGLLLGAAQLANVLADAAEMSFVRAAAWHDQGLFKLATINDTLAAQRGVGGDGVDADCECGQWDGQARRAQQMEAEISGMAGISDYSGQLRSVYSERQLAPITEQLSQGLAALTNAAKKQRTKANAASRIAAVAGVAGRTRSAVAQSADDGDAAAYTSDQDTAAGEADGMQVGGGTAQGGVAAQAGAAGQADETGDARVSATALLVACKAAGAAAAALPTLQQELQQLMQPAGRYRGVSAEFGSPAWHLGHSMAVVENACQHLQSCAALALLLQPPLAALLPPKQAAVLEAAARASNGSGDVPAAWLKVCAALQHVVLPSPAGCSNPGCVNLEGACERDVEVARCSKCGKSSYCCKECQKADWSVHKTICQ